MRNAFHVNPLLKTGLHYQYGPNAFWLSLAIYRTLRLSVRAAALRPVANQEAAT
jgi:hypothetical protein